MGQRREPVPPPPEPAGPEVVGVGPLEKVGVPSWLPGTVTVPLVPAAALLTASESEDRPWMEFSNCWPAGVCWSWLLAPTEF